MRVQTFHSPVFGDRMTAPGIDTALLVYLLFGAGILLPPLPLAGVILAHAARRRCGVLARTHFDRQIELFWRSVLVLLAVALLHAVVVGLGAITFGFGLVLMVLPWGLGLAWLVWAAWQVGSGLLSAWRRQPA